MASDESVNWNVEMEVNLFHAMRWHKPVGVNRHFQMLCIHQKLNSALGRKISAQQIWSHLSSMYDLQALQESEILPFPNKINDFKLPETDFAQELSKEYPRSEHMPATLPTSAAPSRERGGKEGRGGKESRQDRSEKADRSEKTEKPDRTDRVDQEPKGGKGGKSGSSQGGKDSKGAVVHSKSGKSSSSARHTPATPASSSTDSSSKRKRTRHTPSNDTPTSKRRR